MTVLVTRLCCPGFCYKY